MASGMPFSYRFMDDSFNEMYLSEQRVSTIAIVFAILAVFIACLGLFGLVTYMAEQRTKEIGIRKVLGASVQGITVNLPKASEAPAITNPKTKAVSITADGTVYLDTYPVTLTELENLLRQYKAQDPNLPVIIKADSAIAYQKVVDVLDIVGRLEITQLGLVTQRLVK